MNVRAIPITLASALLVAACGTSSGLRVENSGRTVRVTKPAGHQPRVDSLNAVAFVSSTRGWAGGKDAIIATADGGTTWTQQYAGRAEIGSLDFTDDQHGWAVASASLLRTTDGGATWSAASEPAGLVLTGVDFVTSEQGWGIALPAGDIGAPVVGALVSTTDGGTSWSVVKSGVGNSLCVSGGTMVAGAGSRVLRSTDGGMTWIPLLDAATDRTTWMGATVQCPVGSSIWVLFDGGAAAGSQGYAVYASADAGASWRPVVVAPILAGSDPAFRGVTQLDAYSGPFAAVSATQAVFLGQCPGCDPQRVMVLRTQDGGSRWDRHVINGFVPAALAFADADHGWLAAQLGGYPGRHPAILATTDGGRTWHPVYPS
jgi:photosystem II stability/assembly factor-like uncharacterized protein